MDLNDGTRNNVELFRRLRVPITSFSRNPHDRYTVPLPDFHLTLGIYSTSLDWGSGGFGHIKGFAEGRRRPFGYIAEYDRLPTWRRMLLE